MVPRTGRTAAPDPPVGAGSPEIGRAARPPYGFTNDAGAGGSYAANAAPIYVEKAEHLVIRNCELHDGGNGLFAASSGTTVSREILVEGNFVHDNGNAASAYEHNSYTAAIGIVFQFNRYGPPTAGTSGNGLKDRSAGLVVRYNWIEGGNRRLDLVDAEDSSVIESDPAYRATHVEGNVLIEPEGAGNRQIVHYGGDSGNTAGCRKGTLSFHNNTVFSRRTDRTLAWPRRATLGSRSRPRPVRDPRRAPSAEQPGRQHQVERQRDQVGRRQHDRPCRDPRVLGQRAQRERQRDAEQAGGHDRGRDRDPEHGSEGGQAVPERGDRTDERAGPDPEQQRDRQLARHRAREASPSGAGLRCSVSSVKPSDCIPTLSETASTTGTNSASTTTRSNSGVKRPASSAHASPPPMLNSSQGKRSRNEAHAPTCRPSATCTPTSWNASSKAWRRTSSSNSSETASSPSTPTSRPARSTAGRARKRCCWNSARASDSGASSATVTGSRTISDSSRSAGPATARRRTGTTPASRPSRSTA